VLARIDPARSAVQTLVVVPTRELALQVSGVLKQLASASPEKILIMSLMEGSQNRRQQLWYLKTGHIMKFKAINKRFLIDLCTNQ